MKGINQGSRNLPIHLKKTRRDPGEDPVEDPVFMIINEKRIATRIVIRECIPTLFRLKGSSNPPIHLKKTTKNPSDRDIPFAGIFPELEPWN